jgi:DNA polymerase iota
VFLDVTDIVEYNVKQQIPFEPSFFHLSKDDASKGFYYDAFKVAGNEIPSAVDSLVPTSLEDETLRKRLIVGSHLAMHIRQQIESTKGGYTCTAGISTSKMLAKLAGNVHKPRDQSTLMPPYQINVQTFLDPKELRAIPGIGFKSAARLREWYLNRPLNFEGWQLDQGDQVYVRDLRTLPGVGPAALERVLSGQGAQRGIGDTVWKLLHGVDGSEVAAARNFPKQISIEDSYLRLDTMARVKEELFKLAFALVKRMRTDLLLPADEDFKSIRWACRPRTLRLSTRPRLPGKHVSEGGTNITYLHSRISRSTAAPGFLFDLAESEEVVARRLATESIFPMFQLLHPLPSGWNLSLMNVAVANMDHFIEEEKGKRDIGDMFRRLESRESLLIHETDLPETKPGGYHDFGEAGSEDVHFMRDTQSSSQMSAVDAWVDDDRGSFEENSCCDYCGAVMPAFAMAAHDRFHRGGE